MTEIERKFLVLSEAFKEEAFKKTTIIQGFLNTHPERTVRVRIHGNKGFLTVKGVGSNFGFTRFELENEISKIVMEIYWCFVSLLLLKSLAAGKGITVQVNYYKAMLSKRRIAIGKN